MPIVVDSTASLRLVAQTFILYHYLALSFFQYIKEDADDDYIEFYEDHSKYYLLSIASASFLSIIILRSSCFNKKTLLNAIARCRAVEELAISFVCVRGNTYCEV